MKMHRADLMALRQAVEATPSRAAAYESAGLSHELYRWDYLYATGFDLKPLYAYLNDAHVDTALRTILGSSY